MLLYVPLTSWKHANHEIISILTLCQSNITAEKIQTGSISKQREMEEQIQQNRGNSSVAYRYLANKSSINKVVLKKMVFWNSNKTSIQKRIITLRE
jgi:hypothetical protein